MNNHLSIFAPHFCIIKANFKEENSEWKMKSALTNCGVAQGMQRVKNISEPCEGKCEVWCEFGSIEPYNDILFSLCNFMEHR